MIKRYYQGLLSMKYSPLLVGGALLVFLCAFLDIKHPDSFYKYLLMVSAVVLFFIMYLYYTKKIKIHKDIKEIKDIDRYLDAKIIGTSFILEDTMLVNGKEGIKELNTNSITRITKVENRKPTINLQTVDASYDLEATTLEELEKLTAFLKRKSSNVELNGIDGKGSGLLKDLMKR